MNPARTDPVLSAIKATTAGPIKDEDLSVMLYRAKNRASSLGGMRWLKQARA